METDAKVVLSSSWRHFDKGREEVEKQVVKCIDITGDSDNGFRGDEIKAWLDAHSEVERYAIIDDDSDMRPEQLQNFFKTTWAEGITPEICEKVKQHLLSD